MFCSFFFSQNLNTSKFTHYIRASRQRPMQIGGVGGYIGRRALCLEENEFFKSRMSPAATSHGLLYNNYYKLDKLQ